MAARRRPAYFLAKLIIKIINAVAEIVNTDPAVRDRLKMAFLPNLSVKIGQLIYPAADLSEQISTAEFVMKAARDFNLWMEPTQTISERANRYLVFLCGRRYRSDQDMHAER